MGKKTSKIIFTTHLDENYVPEKLEWEATENNEKGDCSAFMLSIWDPKDQNALRIDLWTKEMPVDMMKVFTYQTYITMADTYEKATGDKKVADKMREYANLLGEQMQLLKTQE